jgi:lysophospholipase L1-like esterase
MWRDWHLFAISRDVIDPHARESNDDALAIDGITPAPHVVEDATDLKKARHPLLGKPTAALLVMATLLAIPYASPKLRAFRIVHAPWDKTIQATETTSTDPFAKLEVGETTLLSSANEATITHALAGSSQSNAPPLDPAITAKMAGSLAIEDPTGHALDAFYMHLAKTAKKEDHAVTRILHYGDSLITSDYISGTMRRKMQARFGDAGHGFILSANPWEWYFHNDVAHSASAGWNANRITGPLSADGMYGLGAVTFHGAGGAWATFGTAKTGDYGKKVSRFDLYYMEKPDGADVEVKVTGKPAEKFSTRGPTKVSRIKSIEVPDGENELTVRSWGNGDARLFGVALERDVPGVVYDALGAMGARVRLFEAMNDAHWAEQMALRKPALIVLQFGTNESEDGVLNVEAYGKSLGHVIESLKHAAPDASILVASPLDRAERSENGDLKSKPLMLKLVTTQEKIALEHGVAFWNTFEAMGGTGSMPRWVKATPQLASWDLTHPTPAGAEAIGDLFFKALTTGYEAYASRH